MTHKNDYSIIAFFPNGSAKKWTYVHKLDEFALTHIPLHPSSVGRWAKGNIHGHLHANKVMKGWGWFKKPDPRYICVCVEQTEFKPIDFEAIRSKYANN